MAYGSYRARTQSSSGRVSPPVGKVPQPQGPPVASVSAAIGQDVAQRFFLTTKSGPGKALAGKVSLAVAASLPSRIPMERVSAALASLSCPVRPQQQVLIPMGGIAAAIAGVPVTSLSQANVIAAVAPSVASTPKLPEAPKLVPVQI